MYKNISIFREYVLSFILIFIFIFAVGVKADTIVISEIEVVNNNVSGPGSNNSIIDAGFHYNGSLNFTNRNELEKYNFLFNMGLNTQEDGISKEQILLISRLKASISSKDRSYVVNIGDAFEYFDQYVLNSSLKGISYKYNSLNDDSCKFIFGYDYPRWENLFNEEYQAVIRRSWGVNYNNSQNEDFKWGLSLLNTNDEKGINDGDILYKNNVYGLNWECYPIPGLTVRGNSAYGVTEESEGENYSGTAHKLSMFSNAKEGKASIDYERVDPDFKTLLGSATADREKYKGSLLYRYSERVNYNFDYVYFHDNLDGTKHTTYYHKPGLGVSIRRIFDRRYASTSFKYNLNQKKSNEMMTRDNIYAINYRDRFKLLDLGVNLSYSDKEAEIEDDLNKENGVTYNITLSTRKNMDKYILRPVLRFGYFNNNDETEDSSDSSFEKSFELGLDIPRSRINSSIRLGEKQISRDQGEDNSKLFADLNFYYRPLFLEKYNQGRLYLKLKYNDLSYSENDDKNIKENSITGGITLGF